MERNVRAPLSVHKQTPKLQWIHSGLPSAKNFKALPSAGNILLEVFWESQRLILQHYLELGQAGPMSDIATDTMCHFSE
jgi:hypothetical protein